MWGHLSGSLLLSLGSLCSSLLLCLLLRRPLSGGLGCFPLPGFCSLGSSLALGLLLLRPLCSRLQMRGV